ncbi:hypothetical protein [Streptomyces sp. SAS_260]|uniref:hypothetical protein n=1 Tax=Streptomyces sp. SAS_260 TaxID=3412751 RepID=UPI00403D2B28
MVSGFSSDEGQGEGGIRRRETVRKTFFSRPPPIAAALVGAVRVSLAASLMSAFTLLTYWSADQPITEYPVMAALAMVVVVWPLLASRFSATALAERAVGRKRPDVMVFRESYRRWL